jgi:hypothetical protein
MTSVLGVPTTPTATGRPSSSQSIPPPPPPQVLRAAPIPGGYSYATNWVGGKPDANRQTTDRVTPKTPHAYRTDGEKSTKNYVVMTTAPTTKFKRNDPNYSLTHYSDGAARHMEKCGLDSEFYFRDPSNKDVMLNLFDKHMLFTTEGIKEQVAYFRANGMYDSFATDNLDYSRAWIEDSIDSELWNSLRPHVTRDITGPELYMILVSEVQSDSIQSMRAKERKLLGLRLKDYPGENVRNLNADILLLCDTLSNNRTLPIDTNLAIVDKYTESSSEDFRVHFMTRRAAVEIFMKATAGKDESVIAQLPNPITFKTLTLEASTKYQSLLDTNKWPSAATANDRGGAPDLHANMAKLEAKLDAIGNAVLHQKSSHGNGSGGGGRIDKSQVQCHDCHQFGHMKNECPTSAATKWKVTAPAASDPQSKQVGSRLFHWCASCNRWSTTHATVAKGTIKGHTHRSSQGVPGGTPVPAPDAAAGTPAPATPGPEANALVHQSLLGNFGAW